MAAKDYVSMPLPDLQRVHQTLEKEIAVLRAHYRAVATVMAARQAEAEALRKWGAMGNAERAAIARTLKAQGIESGESMGKIGG